MPFEIGAADIVTRSFGSDGSTASSHSIGIVGYVAALTRHCDYELFLLRMRPSYIAF